MPVITSRANAAVRAARKLARGRASGRAEVLVEGPQALREALGHLQRLFVTEAGAAAHPELVAAAQASGAPVATVAEAVIASLATTVTPQQIIGVAALPEAGLERLAGARTVVIADGVADPGNAGTIIRTADALGADVVVLTAGSVGLANPKLVRASAGSVFHLPVVHGPPFATVAQACRPAGLRLLAATGDGALPYDAADLTGGVAIVFGNEAHGVSAEVLAACETSVRVPLWAGARPGFSGAAESLNLAAAVAVILGEAARQRRAGATGGPIGRKGPP